MTIVKCPSWGLLLRPLLPLKEQLAFVSWVQAGEGYMTSQGRFMLSGSPSILGQPGLWQFVMPCAIVMSLFQFYGYLSQQQNMMQDYVRTGTYQRAILQNHTDFKDKVSCQYRKPTEPRLWVPERLRQGPPLPPSSSVAFFFSIVTLSQPSIFF